ncbi:hypothetical protein WMY93_009219 [Mugilogobius chulae]|uniref:Uncharacterized protein n=1 Tax=Mugilogobius chulae TaxID=88201 RepID=A0AAW0PG41_9GOBI
MRQMKDTEVTGERAGKARTRAQEAGTISRSGNNNNKVPLRCFVPGQRPCKDVLVVPSFVAALSSRTLTVYGGEGGVLEERGRNLTVRLRARESCSLHGSFDVDNRRTTHVRARSNHTMFRCYCCTTRHVKRAAGGEVAWRSSEDHTESLARFSLVANYQDLSCYHTDQDLSCYHTDQDLSCYHTHQDLSCYHTHQDLSCYHTDQDLSCYHTHQDLSCYHTHQDLSCYHTDQDLSCYHTDQDLSCSHTDQDLGCYHTDQDLSCYHTDQDLSCSHTDQDLGCYHTDQDLSCYHTY